MCYSEIKNIYKGFYRYLNMNKTLRIYEILYKKYGSQNWWPVSGSNSEFEIIVGAILAQNTNWKNVEKSIKNLKDNNLLDKDAIKNIELEKLTGLIKSSGYYKQKARKLKEFVNFEGAINRDNLLGIWGIGPETADSILLYAYNQPVFVIDAYTKRIFTRLGFKLDNYDEYQEYFHKNLLKDCKLFNEYHALLVELAKKHCKSEPLCDDCPLLKECKQKAL